MFTFRSFQCDYGQNNRPMGQDFIEFLGDWKHYRCCQASTSYANIRPDVNIELPNFPYS